MMESSQAQQMRREFDLAFCRAPDVLRKDLADFLAVQVGGAPHALLLSELEALHKDRTVVPLPSDDPALLGICGLRGITAPVFDLGVLLGFPAGDDLRWLALTRSASPVALAFERFEGHARLATSDVVPHDKEAAGRHLRGAVHVAGATRSLIHVASLLEVIATRARSPRHSKES